jgi:hypothetical protein
MCTHSHRFADSKGKMERGRELATAPRAPAQIIVEN